jgi:hypothetical protein
MEKKNSKIFLTKDGKEAGETFVIQRDHPDPNFSRSKWQSKMVYHPTYGPGLVTNITENGIATLEILSDDYKETLFKREIPLEELFYNFTFINKLIFALKRFFVIMGKRTFVDYYAKGRDTKGKD